MGWMLLFEYERCKMPISTWWYLNVTTKINTISQASQSSSFSSSLQSLGTHAAWLHLLPSAFKQWMRIFLRGLWALPWWASAFHTMGREHHWPQHLTFCKLATTTILFGFQKVPGFEKHPPPLAWRGEEFITLKNYAFLISYLIQWKKNEEYN